ncbi:MAG: mannitol dehydrogenase family protein [Planctomycetota bacterium]|jgi:fructuronate reductase|nr:mannitol dehydrogenase family protein [Planctomycetota bacterium]
MRLNSRETENLDAWRRAGFVVPGFDREKAAANAKTRPAWVHFGAGNIFRAFPASRWQQLLDAGYEDTGIIVAEGFDYEIIDAVFKPCDNLSVSVTLKAGGDIKKTLVASIVEALKLEPGHPDFERLREVFRAPSLRMASFTITEKGYSLKQGDALARPVLADFEQGPAKAQSYIGKVTALLYERFLAGGPPIAMVSLDNCSHNGDRLFEAVGAFAGKWAEKGLTDAGFPGYVGNPELVSFPWSMIDKITPRPDPEVQKMLAAAGLEGIEPVTTGKFTYVAPFVNAEETEYLVIEDRFPNGRPAFDRVGVSFTDRATVDKVERMKVCTCLNPLHLSLAMFGCPLGFKKISQAMQDPDLRRLVEIVGYDEGLPVVTDPGIINPKAFLDEVLNVRFPNPFMPDTPQRIACDLSQKLGIRFGETIKTYQAREDLRVDDLVLIPLSMAAWFRYLLGVDDDGKPFEVSPDPRREEVEGHLKGIKLGDAGPFHEQLRPALSDASLFAVDLYQAGLGERIEGYFAELTAGAGAVRKTLHKYVTANRRRGS